MARALSGRTAFRANKAPNPASVALLHQLQRNRSLALRRSAKQSVPFQSPSAVETAARPHVGFWVKTRSTVGTSIGGLPDMEAVSRHTDTRSRPFRTIQYAYLNSNLVCMVKIHLFVM